MGPAPPPPCATAGGSLPRERGPVVVLSRCSSHFPRYLSSTSVIGMGPTTKLATSTTAAPMKARAKDWTNARQDDPAKTGVNPKAPPKSRFPSAASIKNVLSGDESEDNFVLKGPAAGAKGARARNTIATPSRLRCRRPKPMKKRAHAEAISILSARRSIEGMKTMPHPGAQPTTRLTTPNAGSTVRSVVCSNP
jgi:hypothetical protein